MKDRIQPQPLRFDSVPKDVKRIAAACIGDDALESLWRTIEDDAGGGQVVFYLILRVVEGDPVGFALFHFEVIDSHGFEYTVGVIDTVCVAPAYRNQGYGSMLTFNVLKRMSIHGVNRIEMVLKSSVQEDGMPSSVIMGSERFLFDLGFRKIAYLHNHYVKPSREYPYDCPICHGSPDECTGVLMAINET